MTHPPCHAPQVLPATAIALPHASPWPPRSPFTTWESATVTARKAHHDATSQCHHNTARRRVKSHCNINCDRATTTATLRQPCTDNNRRRWDVAGHKCLTLALRFENNNNTTGRPLETLMCYIMQAEAQLRTGSTSQVKAGVIERRRVKVAVEEVVHPGSNNPWRTRTNAAVLIMEGLRGIKTGT
ncbi:hypothetical protein EDB84DRAFT_1603617 [Lactarius hengduanensis]|nr:hypothetical protein EDB84DRAFT_1603617 [Lactarius hengduanensis]